MTDPAMSTETPFPFRREFERAIDESKKRPGMQIGLPKVTVDTSQLERLLKHLDAERAARQRAEEALRELLAGIEAVLSAADYAVLRRLIDAARAALKEKPE